jgi:N-acetylmuramoyl-L-alanine amidase
VAIAIPRPRLGTALLAAAMAVTVCSVAAPTAATAASSGPAKKLYEQARGSESRLRKSKKKQTDRAEWEKAVLAYRKVVARYARSGYCDNALLAVGKLYGEMGQRFRSDQYRSDAISAYRMLVSQYPSSSLGDDALWAVVELERDGGNRSRLVKAGKSYVVLDLESKVKLDSDRVGNPERLWIDLIGTRLHPNLEKRVFPVGDGLLERVRIAQNRPDAVRIVLDFTGAWDHSFFYLDGPPRLVIDVTGRPKAGPAMADAGAGKPGTGGGSAQKSGAAEGARTSSATRKPSTRPADLPAPAPPTANRGGSYSLARQLGLGARRIVIDPGHGGHDPGTIGRRGLQEKDLVLDVSVRLAKMLRKELGAEVVMTRSTDVYVPLEERTAIANTKRADLFLSVHANGVRNAKVRGVETYFLNFARSEHAEAVAARENAISQGTLKDLQGLVKAITLNTKIDESRDFASSVQEAMVRGVRRKHKVQDRGVHTAPFYVLIGANMPAVLAEVAFVSNPEAERRLRTAAYRDLLARSLLGGVKSYLEALNRTQTRQLTRSTPRSRVASGNRSR